MNKLIYIISDKPSIEFKKQLINFMPKEFKIIDIGLFDIDENVEHTELVREVYEKLYEHPKALGIICDSENVDLCKLVNEYDNLKAIDGLGSRISDFNVICINTFLMNEEEAKSLIKNKLNF